MLFREMGNRITSKEWNILCGSQMQIRLSYNGPGHEEGVTFTNSTVPTRRFQQDTHPRKGMTPSLRFTAQQDWYYCAALWEKVEEIRPWEALQIVNLYH